MDPVLQTRRPRHRKVRAPRGRTGRGVWPPEVWPSSPSLPARQTGLGARCPPRAPPVSAASDVERRQLWPREVSPPPQTASWDGGDSAPIRAALLGTSGSQALDQQSGEWGSSHRRGPLSLWGVHSSNLCFLGSPLTGPDAGPGRMRAGQRSLMRLRVHRLLPGPPAPGSPSLSSGRGSGETPRFTAAAST